MYEYEYYYSNWVENYCSQFNSDYQVFKKQQSSDALITEKFKFWMDNKEVIKKIADGGDHTNAEVTATCLKHHRNEFIEPIVKENGTALPSISMDGLTYYKLKIALNLVATLLGATIFFSIASRIRIKSEGLYRVVLLLSIIFAPIPYFLSSYNIFATPGTQSITFPATILILATVLYRLVHWILDGFRQEGRGN